MKPCNIRLGQKTTKERKRDYDLPRFIGARAGWRRRAGRGRDEDRIRSTRQWRRPLDPLGRRSSATYRGDQPARGPGDRPAGEWHHPAGYDALSPPRPREQLTWP